MKERLDRYLDKRIKTDRALLIDGEWGVGKTHYINKYISKEKKEEFVYITLRDVKSLLDFYIAMDNKIKKVAKIFSKFKPNFSFSGINLQIDGFGFYKSSILMQYRAGKQTLIIDDLERTPMNKEIILNEIGVLIEEGVKVIFLANEDKIKDKDAYREVKEKYIQETITFKWENKDLVDSLLENYKTEEDFQNYSNALMSFLVNMVDNKENLKKRKLSPYLGGKKDEINEKEDPKYIKKSYRSFQWAIQNAFLDIKEYKELSSIKDFKNNEDILNIFKIYLHLTFFYQQGISMDNIDGFSEMHEKGNKDNYINYSNWNALDYIRSSTQVKKDRLQPKVKEDIKELLWGAYFIDKTDEEIVSIKEKFHDRINKITIADDQLISAIEKHYHEYNFLNITEKEYNSYVEQFCLNIISSCEKEGAYPNSIILDISENIREQLNQYINVKYFEGIKCLYQEMIKGKREYFLYGFFNNDFKKLIWRAGIEIIILEVYEEIIKNNDIENNLYLAFFYSLKNDRLRHLDKYKEQQPKIIKSLETMLNKTNNKNEKMKIEYIIKELKK